MRRLLGLGLAGALVAVCASPAAAPTPTPTPSPTPGAASPAPGREPGAVRFEVQSGSKAIVRVREQLAGVSAPNDAVLESSGVTGVFELRPDGTFTPASKITVALNDLRSDNSRRDGFVKSNTFEVSRFPTADFVPQRTRDLPLPLAASGEWAFSVIGQMTIRGATREVTFAVRAKRDGPTVTASAANNPPWKFGDFGLTIPRVASVLSINDEIRLEMEIVAREAR